MCVMVWYCNVEVVGGGGQCVGHLLALNPYLIAVAYRAVACSGLQKLVRVERTILGARAAREGGLGVDPASVPEVGFAGRTVKGHVLILRIRGADSDNSRLTIADGYEAGMRSSGSGVEVSVVS